MTEAALWNNIQLRLVIAALLAVSAYGSTLPDASDHLPRLLLTPQRLRRLQRDRERQTIRWVDFEKRVQTVPESPERGFELALYYAVTHDEKRGREAVEWALKHPCDRRQAALVLDWCGDLFPDEEQRKITQRACENSRPERAKDIGSALWNLVTGAETEQTIREFWKQLLPWLQAGNFTDAHALYATCEYLLAVRFTQHLELREDAPQFFSGLPSELLLALKPSEVEHPDWMTHIAALALVSLDPNLEGSQYLQGWAIEDRQMLRDGPGVAYELLWGDPYLPGVGYQNLDPWVYDVERTIIRAQRLECGCLLDQRVGGRR